MAGPSDIEWTEATWNPIAGCTPVSPGCTNCYAMRMAARLEAMGQKKYAGTIRKSGGRIVWSGNVTCEEGSLDAPIKWSKPRRIFVNSMSDLFQEAVPLEFIRKVWNVMERADQHTYQILTKRPGRMLDVLSRKDFKTLPHVWLGASIENADYLSRLEDLRHTPSAVRFISFEPLLGPLGDIDLEGIDWAIIGGESGPGARPMEKKWVEELRVSCEIQEVAFFFKQWGGRNKKAAGRTLNGRTWDDYPDVQYAAA